MKKVFFSVMAAMLLLPSAAFAKKVSGPATLEVISFNIRMGEGQDGTNSWQFRCPATIYSTRMSV